MSRPTKYMVSTFKPSGNRLSFNRT